MGVGKDGKVGVHGYVTVDRSGIGMMMVIEIVFKMTAEYQL